jgi:aminopeptidase N
VTLADKTLVPTQIGFTSRDDFTYLLSWVGGCDLFVPCDSRPDRFATSRFTVHHAADLVVRCPGTITEVDATTTVCDFAFEGGPTYSTFAVVAARDWKVSDAGDWSGVRVSVYDLPGTGITKLIKKRAAYYRGFVAFMTSNFGSYPYGDALRILVGPTYWNGFEHPGNIVLSQYVPYSAPGFDDPVAHILMHEIAHMWAGNQTTLATTHDFVWKEAMVEYLTYVYEDSIDPEVAAATLRAWHVYSERATHYPVPDERPPLVDFYSSAYGAGPMILFRQIERLSSRDQVMTALKSLLGRERAIGVADVRRALEASTGLGLDAYFDAWVYGEGTPQWPTFSAVYADGRLAVSQTNAVDGAGAMPCRFAVALHGDDDDDVISVAVDTFRDGPNPTIEVSPAPSFDVAWTEIDPDVECLAYAAPVPRIATVPPPPSASGFARMSTDRSPATRARDEPPNRPASVHPWVAVPPP